MELDQKRSADIKLDVSTYFSLSGYAGKFWVKKNPSDILLIDKDLSINLMDISAGTDGSIYNYALSCHLTPIDTSLGVAEYLNEWNVDNSTDIYSLNVGSLQIKPTL